MYTYIHTVPVSTQAHTRLPIQAPTNLVT